ncbi:MAG TPA: ABC transporter ATP-binding protein [Verrucomicrobia bacterium]|nr:ABC transporter ATP-binding protein [Verrucomicrobiota bacterium]
MDMIRLQDVTMSISGKPLFLGLSVSINKGERIALVGRNGVGKTTLLKVLAGLESPDSGEVMVQPGLRIAFLPQELPDSLTGDVFEVVASGLDRWGDLLQQYHQRSRDAEQGGAALAELGRIQHELENTHGWETHALIEQVITRVGLSPDQEAAKLSGGQKRRALLARALVRQPDLLMLDEPTNHLDIDTVTWLEEFIGRFNGALIFVSHDRRFMRRIANRVAQLDRGRLLEWDCGYDTFVARRDQVLLEEEAIQRRFDDKLAKEEVWIRQGIKARRTRNEGRVKALEQMREQFHARILQPGQVRMRIQQADQSGNKVISAQGVSFAYPGQPPIVKDFNLLLQRGDRLGIIGPNGSGKTTLLDLMLGRREPYAGEVVLGSNVQVAFYDQLRSILDPQKTVHESLNDGKDTVWIDGQKRPVFGYLSDFLFDSERARASVRVLSGGERNRLLLARLFAQPANVLVLDEPTNDLDVETLELLEGLLAEYTGTVLLVSHDREFINNVVTGTLVLDGSGLVRAYAGGYDDYLAQSGAQDGAAASERKPSKKPDARSNRDRSDAPKKLTYKERLELDQLPARIEALEAEQAEVFELLSDPALYQNDAGTVAGVKARATELESKLAALYARWEHLESIAQP